MKLINNEFGHGPDGFGILLILPGLFMAYSLPGMILAWLLILWVPVSFMLLIRKRKK